MDKLLGVVMCGGQSERMGTDKGLIPRGDQTWAQLCYAELSSLGIPIAVSVNATQVQRYTELFDTDKLIIDSQNIPGPLNGILSVHTAYPSADLLVIACDMTAMDNDTLQALVTACRSETGYDIYAYHNGDFFEPLCAIYKASALAALKLIYQAENVTNFSLQKVLKSVNTKRLQVLNSAAFSNLNSK